MMKRSSALRMGAMSWTAVTLATAVGVIAFGWPFLADPDSTAMAHASDAPWIFAITVPMVLLVVLAQVSDGGMDAKAVALLGVLAAVVCVLRPLGAGTAGLEPIWFVIILGGRALGPGFGFALGSLSMGASALLTGGVGPWLPFQMLAAAWVGLGAGLLPAMKGRREIAMVAAYGAAASLAYGLVLNLWFWPFLGSSGYSSDIMFVPGAPLGDNLGRWLAFTIVTSLGWDIPRATITAILVIITGRPVLNALHRAARRAQFHASPTFDEATPALETASSPR